MLFLQIVIIQKAPRKCLEKTKIWQRIIHWGNLQFKQNWLGVYNSLNAVRIIFFSLECVQSDWNDRFLFKLVTVGIYPWRNHAHRYAITTAQLSSISKIYFVDNRFLSTQISACIIFLSLREALNMTTEKLICFISAYRSSSFCYVVYRWVLQESLIKAISKPLDGSRILFPNRKGTKLQRRKNLVPNKILDPTRKPMFVWKQYYIAAGTKGSFHC